MKRKRVFSLLLCLPFAFLAGCSKGQEDSSGRQSNSTSNNGSVFEPSTNLTTPPRVWEEKLSDGGVTLNSDPVEIQKDMGEVRIPFSISWRNTTLIDEKVSLSDTSILPDDAVKVSYTTQDMSNIINGGNIVIDTSKNVGIGEVYIEMSLDSGNTSNSGTVVKKITIVDEIVVDYWNETLIIDFSGLQKNIPDGVIPYLQISDNDHVVGTKNPNTGDVKSFHQVPLDDASNGVATISFQYAVGHDYSLAFYATIDEKIRFCDLFEAVGTGSTAVGYNQYVDGILTFIEEDATLRLSTDSDWQL